MLDSHRKGYAVVTRDRSGVGFESEDIDECKKWCKGNDIVVERIPYIYGVSISIRILRDFWKPFRMKYGQNNILWIHWNTDRVYMHKSGAVKYDPKATE